PFVLSIRVADRVGKGLRTSPRDALIADVTPADRRGKAYGLHRAMDHAGALVGPLVAAALLQIDGVETRDVFLLASVPASLAPAAPGGGVAEKRETLPDAAPAPPAGPRAKTLASFGALPRDFRRMLLAMLVFTLGNATDAFLLLRLQEAGVAPSMIAVLW